MVDNRLVVPAQPWKRSSFCADGACVEVAMLSDDQIGLRDGKNPALPHICVSRNDWLTFLDAVRDGVYANV